MRTFQGNLDPNYLRCFLKNSIILNSRLTKFPRNRTFLPLKLIIPKTWQVKKLEESNRYIEIITRRNERRNDDTSPRMEHESCNAREKIGYYFRAIKGGAS